MKKSSLEPVPEYLLREIILNLGESKATPIGDISADMLKSAMDIHLTLITKIISFSFEHGCFSDELKLVRVSPTFKIEP